MKRRPVVTPGLPTYCPDWCFSDHEQAVEEGCSVVAARPHIGADTCGVSRPRRADEITWNLVAQSDPGEEYGEPLVTVDVHGLAEFMLTSSAARSLARQLEHIADQIEL